MSNCPSCGAEVSDYGVFCPHCGADLKAPPRRAAPAREPAGAPERAPEGARVRQPGIFSVTLRGRSTRAKFWTQFAVVSGVLVSLGTLIGVILSVRAALLAAALGGAFDPQALSQEVTRAVAVSVVVTLPFDLVSGVFTLPMYVRRWHDLGRSGWNVCLFQALGFVPVVGGLLRAVQFLVLGIAPGSREANRFGPPCDARASDAEPSGEDPVALWCLFWLLEAARAAFVVYTLLPLLNPNGD